VFELGMGRPDRDRSSVGADVTRRVGGVHDEIQKHLLQLNAIPQNVRQIFGHFSLDVQTALKHRVTSQCQHIDNDIFDSERRPSGI
jgi:hypothetical protein